MTEKFGVKASGKAIKCSPQKMGLVADLVRGKSVEQAQHLLTFSKKRIAGNVQEVLNSAIANAENNFNVDVDNLYVAEIYVGRSLVLKRFQARAKGRAGKIMKRYCNLTIVLKERSA